MWWIACLHDAIPEKGLDVAFWLYPAMPATTVQFCPNVANGPNALLTLLKRLQYLQCLQCLKCLQRCLAKWKYDEAEKLNWRALEGHEKEMGVHHTDTLTSSYLLAHLLHRQKQHSEARDFYQRACNGFRERLGSQHPTTVACCNHFLAMQQEIKQANPVQSKSLTLTDITLIGKDTYQSYGYPALGSNRERYRQLSLFAYIKGKIRAGGL